MSLNKRYWLMGIACSMAYMLLVPQLALADKITRSCKATYTGYLGVAKKADNKPFFKITAIPDGDLGLGTNRDTRTMISASGECGRTVPNRCRKRASEKIEKCAREHFQNPAQRPASCGALKHYQEFNNLKALLENQVCKRVVDSYGNLTYQSTPRPFSVDVTPTIKIIGDKGCGKQFSLKPVIVQCR
jgi:hypothetical protein